MMRGLYAITSDSDSTEHLLTSVEQALTGGAVIIQYRDKRPAFIDHEQNAMALHNLCKDFGAILIINDDVELAQRINADGVHLGQGDMTVAEARQHLGIGKLIGVSCYNDINLAVSAEQAGADYVALGRFFPSSNKPQAKEVSLDTLRQAREQISVPIVAIGGITAQNGAPLVAAGADMLAVIDGVFGQDNITQAARDIAALF